MQFKKQNQTDSVITLSTKQNHQNFLLSNYNNGSEN